MSASSSPPPPAPDTRLDAAEYFPPGDVTLTVEPSEHDDERAHRLRLEGRADTLKLLKDGTTFLLGWLLVLLIAYKAAGVAFDPTPEGATLASWGRTILGSLIGAFAGYVVGRRS